MPSDRNEIRLHSMVNTHFQSSVNHLWPHSRPTRNWREGQITEKFEWLPLFTVLSASFIYLQERVKHCLEAVRSDFQAKRMKNTPKYYSKYDRIV